VLNEGEEHMTSETSGSVGQWGPRECQLRSLQKIAGRVCVEGSAFGLQNCGQRVGGEQNGVIHLEFVSVVRSTQD
jgi:hypothetical protein